MQASGLEAWRFQPFPPKKTERKGNPPSWPWPQAGSWGSLLSPTREKHGWYVDWVPLTQLAFSTFEDSDMYTGIRYCLQIYSPSLPKKWHVFSKQLTKKKNDVEILWQSIKLHGTWFTAPVDSGINLLHCLWCLKLDNLDISNHLPFLPWSWKWRMGPSNRIVTFHLGQFSTAPWLWEKGCQFHVLNTRLWSINNPTESMNPSSELQKVAPFFPSEFCAWLDPRQAKLCKLCRQNKAQRQISGRGRFRIYIYIYTPPPKIQHIHSP